MYNVKSAKLAYKIFHDCTPPSVGHILTKNGRYCEKQARRSYSTYNSTRMCSNNVLARQVLTSGIARVLAFSLWYDCRKETFVNLFHVGVPKGKTVKLQQKLKFTRSHPYHQFIVRKRTIGRKFIKKLRYIRLTLNLATS